MLRKLSTVTVYLAGFLVVVGVPTYSQALATSTSGNLLYQICLGNVSEQGSCMGYAVAVNDALNELAPNKLCEASVTNQQVVDVVVKYLTVHPEWRQYTAFDIVTAALSEAFPC